MLSGWCGLHPQRTPPPRDDDFSSDLFARQKWRSFWMRRGFQGFSPLGLCRFLLFRRGSFFGSSLAHRPVFVFVLWFFGGFFFFFLDFFHQNRRSLGCPAGLDLGFLEKEMVLPFTCATIAGPFFHSNPRVYRLPFSCAPPAQGKLFPPRPRPAVRSTSPANCRLIPVVCPGNGTSHPIFTVYAFGGARRTSPARPLKNLVCSAVLTRRVCSKEPFFQSVI